jgi:hypothetical protein
VPGSTPANRKRPSGPLSADPAVSCRAVASVNRAPGIAAPAASVTIPESVSPAAGSAARTNNAIVSFIGTNEGKIQRELLPGVVRKQSASAISNQPRRRLAPDWTACDGRGISIGYDRLSAISRTGTGGTAFSRTAAGSHRPAISSPASVGNTTFRVAPAGKHGRPDRAGNDDY